MSDMDLSPNAHATRPFAIEVVRLSVAFGDAVVFENANLAVRAGESIALIGPSGQGKSTLLKSIAGLVPVDSGEIRVEGRALAELNARERRDLGRRMGMLFQKNALFDSLSVEENVAFPLREASGAAESEIRDAVDYFLQAVGLYEARALMPDEISGGMQKRLGIARALALKPEIVLYDDPTAGLDPVTSRKIAALILELRARSNSTIIAVTNDMARAYQLGDRVAMAIEGELLVLGDRAQVEAHEDPRVRQFVRGLLEGPLSGGAGDESRPKQQRMRRWRMR